MRLFTILFVLISIVCASPANAQSNLKSHLPTLVVNGDTTLQHSTVKIVNTGATNSQVKVSRDIISLAAGHNTYFCWGVTCYPPPTNMSGNVMINAADTNGSFIGYLDPLGNHTGVSVVNYCFYNSADISDSVWVSFTYNISVTGVNELTNKAGISGAYPNPADGLTSLSYNLTSSKDARIVIYNMLGSVVKEIKLTDKQSTLIVSTADLKSGVYVYSLIADGKSLSSKKLIVSHR